jgi:hypothetical protein
MLIAGQQGDGKTTCCASLLRAPTMLLYLSVNESHSPTYMSHGCRFYPAMVAYDGKPIPAANPDNLFAVAVDVREEWDTQLLPWVEKIPVGTKLNADQTVSKLCAYLTAAPNYEVASVVTDSLHGLMAVLKETSRWKNTCTTGKGTHNNWAEKDAYLALIHDVFACMVPLKDRNINCILTCGAKKEYIGGPNDAEASAFTPELPSYGVIEHILYLFPDLAPIERSTEFSPYSRVFDFEVEAKKVSMDAEAKKVKKVLKMTPRLLCAGGIPLERLPADLWRIPEFVQGIKESLNG